MGEITDRRLAVAPARAAREVALRNLHTAQAHADFWREPDGSLQVVDQGLNPDIFAEIAALQPALDAATIAGDSAWQAHEDATKAYDTLAAQAPLFPADNIDPIVLLPLRLEAVYRRSATGTPELRIRVYPDDVHVDSHEPELTEREQAAGRAYWQAVFAAGGDPAPRQVAWRALVESCGGPRAVWIHDSLTPHNEPPGSPKFPDVDVRTDAWNRAAHTLLLPDRLEFSAYRDGALVWRTAGADIPDTLPIGLAPKATDGGVDPDALGFDDDSRWLIDFEVAVGVGMGLVVALDDAQDRFDLLTVVGVASHDGATGATRVQDLLGAHEFSDGLTPLPVRTPTNNTPGSRSGWMSRDAPPDPDVVHAWRAAYDEAGQQDAARLARALGIDGRPVLAGTCDPTVDDDALLQRLQRLQAQYYSWSRIWRPASDANAEETPTTQPWYPKLAEHFEKFVRARGPLPPLRVGRQPYGVLPVSATDLWRGNDVDDRITFHVVSFLSVFLEHLDRAIQIGEGPDQDAALLDLLSREASPRALVSTMDFTVDFTSDKPPPASVGSIPAESAFAWVPPATGDRALPDAVEAFPDPLPDPLRPAVASHPLTQLLVLFDESLTHMVQTHTPPAPDPFAARYKPIDDSLWQLRTTPTTSIFHVQAEWAYNTLNNILSSGPALGDDVDKRAEFGALMRDLFAGYVALEDDAIADLPRLERLYRETLEPLSNRVDAWVTSLSTARLTRLRADKPTGIRTGGYGWLTDVGADDPNPQREGYVVTPSLQHATTAAVLRSGWQAHSDRGAFAVDIQSARVRRAQAMIDGVRGGQTVGALLGYQFERALHDARLDRFIAGFRRAYPLATLVDPGDPSDAAVEAAAAAKASIGARNVVDGQALRRDRPQLDADDALAAAAGTDVGGDASTVRRMIAELDETFDAVGDLLLAESVHQLVGGSALRAGLAADAVGRGQDLPAEYDVLRTPRGGIAVTHHVGIAFPASSPAGWADDRPLARLEPGLEAWTRHRFGAATDSPLGLPLATLGWCALELLVATPTEVHHALATVGAVDEAAFEELMLLSERLRGATSGATPISPIHLDPADSAQAAGCDLGELRGRVGAWLADVRAAVHDLGAANTPDAAAPVVDRLAALGLPVAAGSAPSDLDRLRTHVAAVDLADPPAAPDPATDPAKANAWLSGVLAITTALLHPAIRVAPRLTKDLPAAPAPVPAADEIGAWLRDMALLRPQVDALDGALVAAEVLTGTPAASYHVAQPVTEPEGARPWVATAPPSEGARPRNALVLQRDDDAGVLAGLIVDTWTEVVPRPPGPHGPEEIVGVAFDFDRPGARAPQTILIAVPPDAGRGWCLEDVHGCVEEALLLSRVRTLDLADVPALRSVLPVPDGQG